LSWLQAVELAGVIGRGKWAIECFDDDHAATAAWARWRFVVGGGRADVIAVGVRGSRRWHIESPSTEFELVGAMAVGEYAVVTDAMEAGWEDVEQEAAHELANVETHDLAAMTAVLAIVLPAETDMGRVEIEQTAVGDRDAMRIAREIGQDLLRTGEGLFGIDDPFALAQRREVSSPRVGVFELAEIGEELQFIGGVHGFESLQEQAAKQAREHADRQKEAVATGDPALAVRR